MTPTSLYAAHDRLLSLIRPDATPQDVALVMSAVRLIEAELRRIEGVAPHPLAFVRCEGRC